jgi:phosphotriesterase-related protein
MTTQRGRVTTVTGEISPEDMGLTLIHEHILVDASRWWRGPDSGVSERVAMGPVDVSILGELRMDPFANRDNCVLDDEEVAAAELGQVRDLGGRTVVDASGPGNGRDPRALRRISQATGLQIVMGSGFYLDGSHPDRIADMGVDDIADEITRDATEGVDGSGVRAGIIGEIGVSAEFSATERKSLRGAARAQRRTGLPLGVHMPGWLRKADEVLDIVAEEGADLNHTVLCHMNPSGADFDYQAGIAERGAFVQYDMVGMDFYYADQDAQSPGDEENAINIARLVKNGYGRKVLISQDVFLKMMLTCNGGFGYAYILRHFVPRLQRHGLSREQTQMLLVANPRAVFEHA